MSKIADLIPYTKLRQAILEELIKSLPAKENLKTDDKTGKVEFGFDFALKEVKEILGKG